MTLYSGIAVSASERFTAERENSTDADTAQLIWRMLSRIVRIGCRTVFIVVIPSAFTKVCEDGGRTGDPDRTAHRARRDLLVRGRSEVVVPVRRARREAGNAEGFKARMDRTKACGHCLGSLNRVLPRQDDILQRSIDSTMAANAALTCSARITIFTNW